MEPTKSLRAFDSDGNLRDEPVCSMGRVLESGEDLPSGFNHGGCVDSSGTCDLVPCSEDHKLAFPSIHCVGLGQIAPHASTEADCESLFIQSGFLADTRRSRADTRLCERLVMLKHRLARVHCHVPNVRDACMNRLREKAERKKTNGMQMREIRR